LDNEQKKIGMEKITTNAECVGSVYSYGTYAIDTIRITLKEGIRLPRGDYVFVKDDKELPIVYQISYPHWYKPSFDFEESLIVAGSAEKDEHRKRYRCIGVLVGKVDENGEISPPMIPIPPLTDVYKCSPELVKLVTEPIDEWKIQIGINPETTKPVYMALEPLVRQSLLITGAQGTGKTTALLTIIAKAIEANPSLRFLILDWTGEFSSLEQLGDQKVAMCDWEDFVGRYIADKPDIVVGLIEGDPRLRSDAVHDAVMQAIYECKADRKLPTKETVREKVKAQTKRWPSTIQEASAVVEDNIPNAYPSELQENVENLLVKHNAIVIDFSSSRELPNDFAFKRKVAAHLAESIWKKAIANKNFGCVVVSDEAHRICPQFGEPFEKIWLTLATEGGRNCCPFWLVARRLSLVHKNVTVESQQNIVCFNVEDVDRKRIEEDIGTTFSGMLGALPQGEAMVKSAMAFRVPGQTIHVKFDQVIKPASAPYRARGRFKSMAEPI
jgi:hypothetical protein